METIFRIVYEALLWLSRECHTTYNAINIIVYYLLVPLSWTVMLDCIIKRPYTSATLLIIWLGIVITKWGRFEQWCDIVFNKSVAFLLSFERIGWSYTVSSVIICVVIPLVVYVVLIACLMRLR